MNITTDPSTLPLKEQHRLRSQFVRAGQRVLNHALITDYRAAKPTIAPQPVNAVPDKIEGKVSAEMEAIDQLTLDVYASHGAESTGCPQHPNASQADECAAKTKALADAVIAAFDLDAAAIGTALSNPKQDLLNRLNARFGKDSAK